MSDFKVIETQEQLDAIIADRVARAERKGEENASQKYADYEELKAKAEAVESLQKELDETKATIAELDDYKAKLHKYEIDSVKTKVAHEEHIPYEFAARLNGDDEEAIRADAKEVAKFIKMHNAPLGGAEPVAHGGNDKETALRKMVQDMRGD